MPMDTPPPGPSVSPVHRVSRFIRSFLWIALGVCLTLLVTLAIAYAWFGGEIVTAVIAALAAAVFIFGVQRLPANEWTRLGVSYTMLACVLAYFANDDAEVRQPRRIEPIAEGISGAKESYELVMRYGKQHPLGRDFQYRPSAKLQRGQGKWKPKDPAWTAWLTANRAELESGWVNLQPLRTWCAELNVFDRIGDLTPPKSDAEILAYEPIRTLYRHACAVASLQALDGH